MAEDENVQHFGLDASDYFSAIDKLVAKNKEYARSLVDLGENILGTDKNLNQFAYTFKDLDKAPKAYIAALKLLGGEFNEAGNAINLTQDKLEAYLETVKESIAVHDGSYHRSVEGLIKDEDNRKKAIESSIASLKKLQQAKQRVVADDAARLGAPEKEVRTVQKFDKNGNPVFKPLKDRAFGKNEQQYARDVAKEAKQPRDPNEIVARTKKEVEALAKARQEKLKIQEQEVKDFARNLEAQTVAFQKEQKAKFQLVQEFEAKASAEQRERAKGEREIASALTKAKARGREEAAKQDQERQLKNILEQEAIRQRTEQKGRSIRSTTDFSGIQSKDEVEALKKNFQEKQNLRVKEAETLGKNLEAQFVIEKKDIEKRAVLREKEKADFKAKVDSRTRILKPDINVRNDVGIAGQRAPAVLENATAYRTPQPRESVQAQQDAFEARQKLRLKEAEELGKSLDRNFQLERESAERIKALRDKYIKDRETKNRLVNQATRKSAGVVRTRTSSQSIEPDNASEFALQSKESVAIESNKAKQRIALAKKTGDDLDAIFAAEEQNRITRAKRIADAVSAVERTASAQRITRAKADAEFFRLQQQSQLNLPTFGDPSKKGQVTGNLGKVTNLVAKGQISGGRASEILQEVAKGSTAVFTGVEAQVAGFARTMEAAKRTLNDPKFAGGINSQLKQLGGDFEEAETKGKKSAEAILLSWRGMARLLIVQILHTGVREFLTSMSEAIATAAQFQVKLSEIRTITQDQPQSLSTLSKSVRELSDAFGAPIIDVTEGLYETVSNQVGKGATAVNFLTKSLEFAKVTGSTTADSVNLLSSALNSFGLDASQTERVAATFFGTIDKGRLRAQDIANTFGRVGPIAKNLGVSLEEVGGSLATLTIKGVPPSEAITLLTNVLSHLAKPTQDMKKFFDQLGVSTGEQAIAIYGFSGVLSQLEKASNGSSEQLAELFRDIRAIKGATVLAGDGLKELRGNIDYLNQGGQRYDAAKAIAVESPGAQLLKQLQQVKNLVLTDFGTPVLQQILNLSKALDDNGLAGVLGKLIKLATIGGALFASYKIGLIALSTLTAVKVRIDQTQNTVNIANAASGHARVLAIHAEAQAEAFATKATQLHTAGLIAESEAAGVSAVEHRLLALQYNQTAGAAVTATRASVAARTALSGIGAVLTSPAFLATAAIAGVTALAYHYYTLGDTIRESYLNAYENAGRFVDTFTKANDEAIAKQTNDFEAGLNRQFSSYQDFASKVSDQLDKLSDKYREAAEEQKKITTDGINSYVKEYEDGSRKVEEANRKTQDAIRKSEEDLIRIRENAADSAFKKNLRQAEQKDRLAAEGQKTVQKNQLDLINAEVTRLQGSNATLAVPTGDVNIDLVNREQIQKNIVRLDELLTLQQEKRFQIEADRQRIAKEIADLQAKETAQAAQRSEQDKRDALEAERRAKPRRGQPDPLTGAVAGTRTNERNSRRGEQDRSEQSRLDTLKAQLAALDAGLKILPDTNALQQRAIDLEKEQNAQIQKRIDLLNQQKAAQEGELKAREKSFGNLKLALNDLEKFKFDPKNQINKPEELASQLAKFDELIAKAQAAGLQDQVLLNKLVQERVAIEQEGQAKIAIAQQKANSEKLIAEKKALEAEHKRVKAATGAQSNAAGDAARRLFQVVGGPTGPNAAFEPGPISNAKIGKADFSIHDEVIQRIRTQTQELLNRQKDLIERGVKVDPIRFQELNDTIAELRRRLEEYKIRVSKTGKQGLGELTSPGDFTLVPSGTDPITGKPTKGKTGFDLVKDAEAAAAGLINSIKATQVGADQIAEYNASIASNAEALKFIQESYGKLNQDYIAGSKTFKQLVSDVETTVLSMQKLNEKLNAIGTGQINLNSGTTPFGPPKFAFGGSVGTDTMVAAVTPGEFIMNKKSTRKFYRQLVQMNRYEYGGVVDYNPNIARPIVEIPERQGTSNSNMSIGPIYIQGAENARYDARTLGREIFNEVRKGNLRAE